MKDDYEYLLIDNTDQVATITVNRAEKRNAWNRFVTLELFRALSELDADEKVRAIIVTGAGKTFSVGADLEEGPGRWSYLSEEDQAQIERELAGEITKPWELDTPIIAAINGHAIGVGMTIPLLFDIRIVAEDAKLAFIFNRRGLLPEANSLWLLSRLVGASRAFELLLTGRYFSGREAAEIGLATRAVPADEVLTVANQVARDIADNTAPVSAAMTKRLFYRFLETSDRNGAMRIESAANAWIAQQPDMVEGVMSFMQKRAPEWKMNKKDAPDNILDSDV